MDNYNENNLYKWRPLWIFVLLFIMYLIHMQFIHNNTNQIEVIQESVKM